ncbi:MAG: glycoside hydrolase family 1 protein, partial [Deltaproteobacteria bacterium]
MKLNKTIEFPKDFLWGTAASSHQVEGENIHNDWWDWEQKPDKIKNGDKSGKACNHYQLYETDFRILAGMGTNAHRLGIEWSRIVPEEGTINRDAIDHYKRVLDSARKAGLEVFATTHHFTSPLWFTKKGGFLIEKNLDYFKQYIEIIARELSPLLNYWNTINEPAVYAVMGWMNGIIPPGHQDVGESIKVLRNIILAHAAAYQGLKEYSSNEVQVGIVKNVPHFVPSDPESDQDIQMAATQDNFFNEYHLQGIETGVLNLGEKEEISGLKGSTDFYGLNYYVEMICDQSHPTEPRFSRPDEKKTQMGWGVHPSGLYASIMRLKKYGRPIY